MRNILLMLLIWPVISWSQSYYMNVKQKGGATAIYQVDNISKITFTGVTSVEDQVKINTVLKTFTLLQNYPNPFNPSTTIEYILPQAGEVKINIYTIIGQLVYSLRPGAQQEGLHHTVWNGKNENGSVLSSGTYFYQVVFNNSVITKKMMYLK